MGLGLISLAISAVSAVGSAIAGKKAAKNSKRAAASEKKIRDIRNVQAKRDFLKKFRLSQAETIAAAGAREGGLDSSRSQGTVAGSTTQAKVGIAEQNRLGELDAEATTFANRAARFKNNATAIRQGGAIVSSALDLIPKGPKTNTTEEQPLGGN